MVSIGYRLAPEFRAPTAVHDGVDSVRWLAEHADSLGGNASRLAVAGDSSGGNLAAVVCQVVRDEGGHLDPLRDEGALYAELLAAAGVPVRHTNYVGVPHGFASFPGVTTVGQQHRAELVGELRRHLHP